MEKESVETPVKEPMTLEQRIAKLKENCGMNELNKSEKELDTMAYGMLSMKDYMYFLELRQQYDD